MLVADNETLYPDTSKPVVLGVERTQTTETILGGVYPNPFRSTLNILSNKATTVEVFDILGRKVFSQRVVGGQAPLAWTPRNLSYGVYFVRVGGTRVKPFKVLYAP